MRRRIDPTIVAQQISNLLRQNPELAEDGQLRADMVEGSTDGFDLLREFERKHRDTETLIAGLHTTLSELQQRAARLERRSQAMRHLMFKIMMLADLPKVELPEATLSIRNGMPKVIITDEKGIPDTLCRVRREPDKAKIKELLLAGNPVQGACLSNSEQTLAIRIK